MRMGGAATMNMGGKESFKLLLHVTHLEIVRI